MKLTVLKNPFNIASREIYDIDKIENKTIEQYCQPYILGLEDMVYSVNGATVDASYVPEQGDYMAVCPKIGKGNWLGQLLSVALMVYAPVWGKSLAGASSFMAGVYTAAIMYLGGQLINKICPPPKVDTPSMEYSHSNPAYGWGGITANLYQGSALPITYGTMKTAGTEFAKHVTVDGANQYLNVLLCGGQGELDSITDIRINNNPIANYTGVVVDTRLGTNDQAVITNFNDSYADQGLSYELVAGAGWSTQQIESNAAQGLEIMVECPSGLYHLSDSGANVGAWVSIVAEYRLVDGEWAQFGTWTISDNSTSAIRRSYRVDNITAGKYEVRVKCTGKSGDTTRDATKINWIQLSSIIYDDFLHPGKALVGIKALATSQLSGSDINVTWIQTRSKVWVWNGTEYVQKPATNPAWVSYDILHSARRVKNIHTGNYEFIVDNNPASRLEYNAFQEWADHCDLLKLDFNHIFDSTIDLFTALKTVETFGRGKVIMKGTRFSCIVDKPAQPVQLFSVANIMLDSFSKSYMSLKDRANAVEITFVNKEKSYQKDQITVYSKDWDTSKQKTPTQIQLDGCTSYELAYKYGYYALRCNKYLNRTCKWTADIDAISCQIGDNVLVQHNLPEWGDGGRIVSATANTLTLDKQVEMVAGNNYSVVIRYMDDSMKTVSVVNTDSVTDQLQLQTTLDVIPTEDCMFAFGIVDKQAKPFTVIDISRNGDLTAVLTGMEYVPAVYDETVNVPVISYTPPIAQNIIVSANEIWPRPSNYSNIAVTWSWPRRGDTMYATVFVDDVKQSTVSITEQPTFTAQVNSKGSYTFRVEFTNGVGIKSGSGSVFYTIGKEYLQDVTGFTDYYDNGKLMLSWVAINDYRPIMYEIRKGSNFDTAQILGDTPLTKLEVEGNDTYWVIAKTGSVVSQNPARIIVTGSSIVKNVIATYDEQATNWLGSKTDGLAEFELAGQKYLALISIDQIFSATDFYSIPDVFNYGNMVLSGTYTIPDEHIIDVGTEQLCNVSVNYSVLGVAYVENFFSVADVYSLPDFFGFCNDKVSAQIEINIAGNDDVWQGWKPFIVGQYKAKKYKLRITLNSTDVNARPVLTGFKFSVDVPDKTDAGTWWFIPSTGKSITYYATFNATPNVQITILNAQEGDRINFIAQPTKLGFTVNVTNGGIGVDRRINWLAQGY